MRDAEALFENLDDRVMAGFGGVAEYGITVRWNKNYLKLVRLLLERRVAVSRISAASDSAAARRCRWTTPGRWVSTTSRCAWAPASRPCWTFPTAWRAACAQASDFLMALQLTGAAKFSSIANLQVRLPVVVIGGGLTAIDTATESLAYYVRQVEKFALRYHTLVAERGEAAVRRPGTPKNRRSPTNSWPTPPPSAPNATPPRARAGRRAWPRCWTSGAAPPSPIAAA